MKYKILIVDDEPVNLRTLERLFRRDYQTVTAQSGAEALTLLEQHDVALLISDQRMPEMTGIELMKKAVELRPQMVTILLTAYTDINALIEAINSGLVYRYMTKPWNNDDLRVAVTQALDHYEMIKARHLLEMENRRLRLRLRQINELSMEVVSEVDGWHEEALDSQVQHREHQVAHSEPEVYELRDLSLA
jgi:DNA-binding NtrC family response regulator